MARNSIETRRYSMLNANTGAVGGSCVGVSDSGGATAMALCLAPACQWRMHPPVSVFRPFGVTRKPDFVIIVWTSDRMDGRSETGIWHG